MINSVTKGSVPILLMLDEQDHSQSTPICRQDFRWNQSGSRVASPPEWTRGASGARCSPSYAQTPSCPWTHGGALFPAPNCSLAIAGVASTIYVMLTSVYVPNTCRRASQISPTVA